MQVCNREEGEGALESIKQKVLEKDVAEDVAEQQLSTEVMLSTVSISVFCCTCECQ